MDGVTDSFLHGHPTVYDLGCFILIVVLLLSNLGATLQVKKLRRKLDHLSVSHAELQNFVGTWLIHRSTEDNP